LRRASSSAAVAYAASDRFTSSRVPEHLVTRLSDGKLIDLDAIVAGIDLR